MIKTLLQFFGGLFVVFMLIGFCIPCIESPEKKAAREGLRRVELECQRLINDELQPLWFRRQSRDMCDRMIKIEEEKIRAAK